MKILVYSDNHFCQYSSILRSRGQKFSKRLENGIQTVNFVEQEAVRLNCDQIVCCGDFFDKPILNAEELSALNEITWAPIPHVFLVGNHEMASNDLQFNSVNALTRLGFTIVSQPSVQYDATLNGVEICYLPYQLDCTGNKISDYFNSQANRRIIFSHNDIAGIQMGKFVSVSGLDQDDIENSCDYFINGHIHNTSWVKPNILNLGNITGMNFSEDGFKYMHLYAVVDTHRLTVETFNNPYALRFSHIDESNYDRFLNLKNDNPELVRNFILSIKIPQDKLTETRRFAEELGLMSFKCIGINNQVIESDKVETFTQIDYLNKFIDYFKEKYGQNDYILDELSKVVI